MVRFTMILPASWAYLKVTNRSSAERTNFWCFLFTTNHSTNQTFHLIWILCIGTICVLSTATFTRSLQRQNRLMSSL